MPFTVSTVLFLAWVPTKILKIIQPLLDEIGRIQGGMAVDHSTSFNICFLDTERPARCLLMASVALCSWKSRARPLTRLPGWGGWGEVSLVVCPSLSL